MTGIHPTPESDLTSKELVEYYDATFTGTAQDFAKQYGVNHMNLNAWLRSIRTSEPFRRSGGPKYRAALIRYHSSGPHPPKPSPSDDPELVHYFDTTYPGTQSSFAAKYGFADSPFSKWLLSVRNSDPTRYLFTGDKFRAALTAYRASGPHPPLAIPDAAAVRAHDVELMDTFHKHWDSSIAAFASRFGCSKCAFCKLRRDIRRTTPYPVTHHATVRAALERFAATLEE